MTVTRSELIALLDRVSAYFDYSTSPLGMAVREMLARLEAERVAASGRTHWDGCWREHHGCAVALLDAQR